MEFHCFPNVTKVLVRLAFVSVAFMFLNLANLPHVGLFGCRTCDYVFRRYSRVIISLFSGLRLDFKIVLFYLPDELKHKYFDVFRIEKCC